MLPGLIVPLVVTVPAPDPRNWASSPFAYVEPDQFAVAVSHVVLTPASHVTVAALSLGNTSNTKENKTGRKLRLGLDKRTKGGHKQLEEELDGSRRGGRLTLEECEGRVGFIEIYF